MSVYEESDKTDNDNNDDDNDDPNDPDFIIDAGSATEVNKSDKDGSFLEDPFIFTEESFNPKEPTTEERESEHEHRTKTLMARRLGKVESKKQSKAEKGNKKKFGIIQQNANSKKSSTNPQTASPDKNNLNKDDDDSKLDSRIKTIAARRHGRVEAMKEARVDMASEGNHSSTPPVNTELSINKRSTSSANSDINDNIDKRNSNDPKLIDRKKTVMARRSGKLDAMNQVRAEESVQKDI